jgi:type II secretory pathway pseudopilin PulG
MSRFNNRSGFTLIELMLAMGFVSALLLAIAMTVIQIGDIYNRSITYTNVNQAGSALASELQRDINQSSPFDVSDTKNVFVQQGSPGNYSGGRLCIGQYSYIWNYGYALQHDSSFINKYVSPDTDQINFVKVPDSDGSYCTDATTTEQAIDPTGAIELLNTGGLNLAIQSFSITSDAYDSTTGQRIYNISFYLATNNQNELNSSPNSSATACLTPDSLDSNQGFCAISQFNILARAGNVTE